MKKREYPLIPIAAKVEIACEEFFTNALPENIVLFEDLGILGSSLLDGYVIHRADTALFEVRGVITPKGDYLVMFPAGAHYASSNKKANNMIAYRSSDKGNTWIGPVVAFDIDYNQHGFIPLIPRGSDRIYCFGTQPVWENYSTEEGQRENAPIGYFYSDDDGHTWVGPTLIVPTNDEGFKGMSVTRMCETDDGTWLLGAHDADWDTKPLITKQYILRSEDKGLSWEVLPGKRPEGWDVPEFKRMDEGRVLNLHNGNVYFMIRTPAGKLWATRSCDDGKTWLKPEPTPLVQPDAPPMIELLPDNKTIVCLHHNRHHDLDYTGLSGEKEILMRDRSEVWVSLSPDQGKTWEEPRFLFANALIPNLEIPFRNYQCSYIDMFIDDDNLHLLVPHRWQQVVHLTIAISELRNLPTKQEVLKDL